MCDVKLLATLSALSSHTHTAKQLQRVTTNTEGEVKEHQQKGCVCGGGVVRSWFYYWKSIIVKLTSHDITLENVKYYKHSKTDLLVLLHLKKKKT